MAKESREWAMVTGASTGIGLEFCRLLAFEKRNLILVARDKERLDQRADELREEFGVQVEVLPADLTDKRQLQKVANRLRKADQPVSVLINNAGLGLNQRFATGDLEAEQTLVDLLVVAPMRLTHAVLPGMKERGKGDVVIVSSVASFIAGGTYSAAKAWATVFAEGLAQELRGTGVHISALCPGFTHTEFHARAGINKQEIPKFMWLDARRMVRAGWRDHCNGAVVSVPSLRYKSLVVLTKVVPRGLVRRVGFSARNRSRK